MISHVSSFSLSGWVLVGSLLGCATPAEAPDLVIRRATLLDVRDGSLRPDVSIVIVNGRIARIVDGNVPIRDGRQALDAAGRVVTPGLIDVHHHVMYVLGDSITAGGSLLTHLASDSASVAEYRQRFARAYLPFGVTSVRDAGSDDHDVEILRPWRRPDPSFPDYFPVGGAIISADSTRTAAPGHVEVHDPDDARRLIQRYYALGIRHVKLYWRLREPEFAAALDEARTLGMQVTGHVDYRVMSIDQALDLGLRSFEHAYTIGVSALTSEEWSQIWSTHLPRSYGERRDGLFFLAVPEYFNVLGPHNQRMERLIDRLAAVQATVTPTLHIFAQRLGMAPFTSPSMGGFDRTAGLTPLRERRARAGYRLLSDYVREMHERGVMLTVGTDWVDPGPAVLSEMSLLHEAGIDMRDVFRIATWNGAVALGVQHEVGNIEVGKRANLVIFDSDPLENPANLWSGKTVLKDGHLYPR